MCGITGVFHFDKDRFVEKGKIKRMTDIIEHRGPDGEGFYINKNIGLGHRRLSIIDLDTGDQPMLSDDKKRIIVFNGEIYNYIELRNELTKKGYQFYTQSDTEVILKSYEEWGYDCQKKFNGMWAFAIWDMKKQELFLSRDRIGEKPLTYAVYDNTFIFGSEMKSLFSFGIPKNIDLSLMEIYLVLTNIPEPFTFYKGVKKLRAGHYLIVKNNIVQEIKYWDLPDIDESDMITDKEYVYNKFEDLFKDSVKIRMRSDVPFGAFLSGGLDSSSIVSVMSEQSRFPVNTFTIGFQEKVFDESKLAAEVANKFKTNHYVGYIDSENFEEIIKKVTFHFDEPFGDSSAIPTGYVSKFAREKVKMVLTGDGGDEVLSGYNSYAGVKIAQLYQKFPTIVHKILPNSIDFIKQYTTGSIRLRLNTIENLANSSLMPFNKRIIEKRSFADYRTIKNLLTDRSNIYGIEDYFNVSMKGCKYEDEFYKLMYRNFKFDLPNDYLVKVDRMSMANSIETRVPFLDYRLIEFMVGVDKRVKMQGWERKSILRNTIGKTLPVSLLKTSKKGFVTPLREWFKDDSFDSVVEKNLKDLKGILNEKIIDKIVLDNKNGINDHGNFIWTLMQLNKVIV